MIEIKTTRGDTRECEFGEALQAVQAGEAEPVDRRTFNRLKAEHEASALEAVQRRLAARAEATTADREGEALEAARAAFEAGELPDDIADSERADGMVGRGRLVELGEAAGAQFAASATKPEIAIAIIAARAGAASD